MASANPSVTDIIATTLESRTGELADNVSIHMPLLMRMKSRGNIEPIVCRACARKMRDAAVSVLSATARVGDRGGIGIG